MSVIVGSTYGKKRRVTEKAIQDRQDFKTSGALRGERTKMYGTTEPGYVVYSYAAVIAEYDPVTELWYLNTRKYSVTTSRHQSLVRFALHDEIIVVLR